MFKPLRGQLKPGTRASDIPILLFTLTSYTDIIFPAADILLFTLTSYTDIIFPAADNCPRSLPTQTSLPLPSLSVLLSPPPPPPLPHIPDPRAPNLMRHHDLLTMNQVMNNYDLRAYSIGFYEDLLSLKRYSF